MSYRRRDSIALVFIAVLEIKHVRNFTRIGMITLHVYKKRYILIFIVQERLRIIKNTLKVIYLNFTFKSHLARHSVSATQN